jgi:hypothetical protein
VSMLRCWHLVWILVWTDHPCLGVGCHSCYLSLLSLCMLCILSTLILNHGVLICWFLFMQSLICIRANQYWVCSCLVIICLNASSLISECCLIYLIFHNCNWTSINGMLLNRKLCALPVMNTGGLLLTLNIFAIVTWTHPRVSETWPKASVPEASGRTDQAGVQAVSE